MTTKSIKKSKNKTMKKFYITTTIPYANAPPHIGFAMEIIQADVIARWHKLLGEEVFFLTGTDEHGSKNYRMAKEAGLTPQQFVDKNSLYFKELTEKFNITNNFFIRTTDKKIHWPGVFDIWKLLEKNGDIYKKKYTGCYCTGCERFVTEKDLVDGKCSDHPNLEVEEISEENYFFRLSKYSDKIRSLVEKDKLKIFPEKWKNNFLGLIKDGLTDVSFTREKKHLPWGIPVPGDENQVMYVWPDALTNYLTGVGYPDKKYKKYWPADVHLVGKDMLRFHAGIWPGMLLSAGLPLPREIIVHGFLVVGGQKMSKSLGNVIAPLEMVKKYDTDSIRYFLMRTIPFGDDGNFTEDALTQRHNDELANKLGNLVSRISTLTEKYGIEKTENKLLKKLNLKEIETHFKNYELDKALNEIFAFIDACNEYTQNKKPWETQDKKVLYELADSIKAFSILLWPFIPSTSEKIAQQFGFEIKLENIDKPLNTKHKIVKGEILFTKILTNLSSSSSTQSVERKKIEVEKKEEKINKQPEVKEIMAGVGTVNFADWEKIDLRVAQIKKVEDIEGADKLYKLTINVGELGERVICAGIKQFYTKEKLKNKKIIVFANLAPRMMRGIESQGMLLAASSEDHKKVLLLSPDEGAEPGMRVS